MGFEMEGQSPKPTDTTSVGKTTVTSDPPTIPERYRCGMVATLDIGLWQKLDAVCSDVAVLPRRHTLSRAGEPLRQSALLLEGVMCRYIRQTDDDTGNRAMVSIQVPGDFVDLHALPLGHLDHDVCTLTEVRLAFFTHDDLLRIMGQSAEDARALWRLTMVDAAIHRHWIYRNARLRAMASVSDFLCEMDIRLRACGAVVGNRFELPLLQADLADILGLSNVHVSRVCKDLRDAGLCTIGAGQVTVHDREGLQRMAGFDPGYLYPSASLDP